MNNKTNKTMRTLVMMLMMVLAAIAGPIAIAPASNLKRTRPPSPRKCARSRS